jgi:hypothetical protein|tara:strand:+ start:831 stop:1076 length:246 start_codon:yes stop_codon:yes gene_type:complete
MYLVKFVHKNSEEEGLSEVLVAEKEQLFHLLWALEHSSHVLAFCFADSWLMEWESKDASNFGGMQKFKDNQHEVHACLAKG